MAKLRLSSSLQFDSIVDGEGLRAVIWTQGCCHHCEGCHNPDTHNLEGGFEVSLETLQHQLQQHSYLDGITFSGGEPMLQADLCSQLARFAKQCGMNVWCYTGYTIEQLWQTGNESQSNFLQEIDVLVDGRFEIKKRSLSLLFRGSTNQRCIDMKNSSIGKIVLIQHEN